MEWNVKNALDRDVERQHLNKILKEIRTAVDESGTGLTEQQVVAIVQETLASLPSTALGAFTISLTGDASGEGTSNNLSDVTIPVTIDPSVVGISDAPNDSNVYWRGQNVWQAVPGLLRTLAFLESSGLLVYDESTGWTTREIEGVTGEIDVVDGDGVASNPSIGLSDVTVGVGGELKKYAFDSKGRLLDEDDATTDDLDEGVTNLYFTDDRAQDAVGAILTDTADVELDYDDGAPSISAVLTTAVHDSLDLADTSIQPGDNISELTNDEAFLNYTTLKDTLVAGTNVTLTPDDLAETITIDATGGGGGSGTVTSVALSVPTGLVVSGSPITTSGAFTVSYDTGYQGYTTAEASKLSGIEAGATAGADWNTNLANIPANITSWASIAPADKWDTSSATAAGLTNLDSAAVSSSNGLLGGFSRFFSVVGTDTPGGAGVAYAGFHASRSAGAATQLIAQVSTSSTYGTLWTRVANSAVWGAWRRVCVNGDSQIELGTAPLLVYDTGSNSLGFRAGPSGSYRYWRMDANGFLYTLNGGLVAAGQVQPSTDNTRACGTPSERWTVVHAATGTINTSDAREKTEIIPLTTDELNAASDLAKEIGKYKWLESIDKKGDEARFHIGLTVQRAIEIMESHGLDPFTYGFICYDQWDTETGGEGIVERQVGDRYSFRPDELLMFIARGQEERLARLEALLGA